MILRDDKILLAGKDFHFEVSICRVYGVEFVDYSFYSLGGGFGEDDGADVVFIGESVVTEVHVGYVTDCCEAAWYILNVFGEGCREDFICVRCVKRTYQLSRNRSRGQWSVVVLTFHFLRYMFLQFHSMCFYLPSEGHLKRNFQDQLEDPGRPTLIHLRQ